MVLESFCKFIIMALFIGIMGNFAFRYKLYKELYMTIKKYPKEFEKLGIDKNLLYFPEFCNFKKIKKQIDMSNDEIASVIKRLNISKYSLWGSFLVTFVVAYILMNILKLVD